MLSPQSPSTTTALPPWDRVCDVAFARPVDAGPSDVFARTVALLCAQSGRTHRPPAASRLFRLPVAVRLCLYEHILGTADSPPTAPQRPIRLNPMVHNRLAWPADAFDALWDVLAPLQPLLSASAALRVELLAALFLVRSFHLTWSPFVRPATAPLATAFVHRYGCLMQHLTLELDCTRLGYGRHAAAARLGPGMLHVDGLVRDFVAAQQRRAGHTTMARLVVLCRRFHGRRPAPPAGIAVHYVGPEHEHVAQQLAGLAGLVDAARVAGFSTDFADRLVRSLQPDGAAPTWRCTPSDVYPLLPGHQAYLDYGPRLGVRLSPAAAPEVSASSTTADSASPSSQLSHRHTSMVDTLERKLTAGIVLGKPRKLRKRRLTGLISA